MKRILFVCLGNICRSPMAEFILKTMAAERGLDWTIESAALSGEEEGSPVYPAALRTLRAHGVAADPAKRARRVRVDDYARYDRILAMESRQVDRLHALFGGDPERKIACLTDAAGRPRDIADPWYTGDFERAYRDIREGCAAIAERADDCGA